MSHVIDVHLSQTETKKIYNKYNLLLDDLLKGRYIMSLRFFTVVLYSKFKLLLHLTTALII